MTDLTEMRWLLDQITNRRMNDQVMRSAQGFAEVFLNNALKSGNTQIDSNYIQRNSIELAKAMLAGYVDNKLI